MIINLHNFSYKFFKKYIISSCDNIPTVKMSNLFHSERYIISPLMMRELSVESAWDKNQNYFKEGENRLISLLHNRPKTKRDFIFQTFLCTFF